MRRAGLLLVCAWMAVGAVVWSNDSTDTAAASTPTFRPEKPAIRKGDLYVSVGSSMASGFGIANQSTEGCGRSDRSYAHIVAAKYKLELVDVSCGAASIPNVLDTPQGDKPPQIDAVTSETKLITIGLGGNDIGYNGTALACGDPATVCTAPPTLAADSAALPGKVEDMLAKLKAKAPSATIVLVTYPREFPKTNCTALSLTDEELLIMQRMGTTVEKALVAAAHKAHVLLADPYVKRGDHTGCAPASKRWAAGYEVTDGFAYHPTALGHEVMAKLILKALAS